MEGMASGESRDVAITMPDTWDPPQLRGARVNCSVTVNEIFEWELPEVRAGSRSTRSESFLTGNAFRSSR